MSKKVPKKGKGSKKAKGKARPKVDPYLPMVIPQPPKPPVDKGGRPELISPEMANEICLLIAEGYTIRQVTRLEHLPSKATVLRWASGNEPHRKWFRDQYARAREIAAWGWFDEMFEIADDGSNDWLERELDSGLIIKVPNYEHIARSKVRLDLRKWGLSKFLKNTFGKIADATADTPKELAAPIPEQVKVIRQAKPDK